MLAGGSGTAIVEETRSVESTWTNSPGSSSRQSGLVSIGWEAMMVAGRIASCPENTRVIPDAAR